MFLLVFQCLDNSRQVHFSRHFTVFVEVEEFWHLPADPISCYFVNFSAFTINLLQLFTQPCCPGCSAGWTSVLPLLLRFLVQFVDPVFNLRVSCELHSPLLAEPFCYLLAAAFLCFPSPLVAVPQVYSYLFSLCPLSPGQSRPFFPFFGFDFHPYRYRMNLLLLSTSSVLFQEPSRVILVLEFSPLPNVFDVCEGSQQVRLARFVLPDQACHMILYFDSSRIEDIAVVPYSKCSKSHFLCFLFRLLRAIG